MSHEVRLGLLDGVFSKGDRKFSNSDSTDWLCINVQKIAQNYPKNQKYRIAELKSKIKKKKIKLLSSEIR